MLRAKPDGRILAQLNLTSGGGEQGQHLLKRRRVLCKCIVDGAAQQLPMRQLQLLPEPDIVGLSFAFGILNNGKMMLRAYLIAESSDRSAGAKEVTQLPLMIKRDQIPNDVIMAVSLVGMSADDEGILPLQETTG